MFALNGCPGCGGGRPAAAAAAAAAACLAATSSFRGRPRLRFTGVPAAGGTPLAAGAVPTWGCACPFAGIAALVVAATGAGGFGIA